MTITQLPADFNPVCPAYLDDPEFPYDVQQFRRIICLSSRSTRLFIRRNFVSGVDYQVVGKQHKMMLSHKCLAVAISLQYKFANHPYLIDRNSIPHYSLYMEDVAAAVDRLQLRRKRRRLFVHPDYEQLSFNFASC